MCKVSIHIVREKASADLFERRQGAGGEDSENAKSELFIICFVIFTGVSHGTVLFMLFIIVIVIITVITIIIYSLLDPLVLFVVSIANLSEPLKHAPGPA